MNQVIPPGGIPLLGQQQQQAQATITQAARALSMQIYTRLAASRITDEELREGEVRRLHTLAQSSMVAAMAYFEGIGVIKMTEIPNPNPNQQEKDQGNGEEETSQP